MAENNLGTASVDITASLEPLQKGLAQARSDLQTGLDGMSRDTEKWGGDVGKVIQGVTDKFRNLASLFGVGFGIREIISTIEESQTSLARLSSVLQSTGGAAGYSRTELVRMASALQDTSNFSRTAVQGAEGVLLTFTHLSHDVFPQALQASVNLASAMGTDLSSAARQVGRALDDPVKGMMLLSREGVSLSASQSALVKHFVSIGDLASADAIVLDVLRTKFGGAASAAKDTLGGAFDSLGHSIEDLTNDFGDAGFGGALKNNVKDIADETAHLQGLAEWIGNVAGAIISFPRNAALDLRMAFGGEAEASAIKHTNAVANLNDILNAGGPGRSMPLHGGAPGASGASGAATEAAAAQKRLQESFAKTNESITMQTADYARLTDAIGKGVEAQRAAQIANDVASEQSKLGGGATPAMLAKIQDEITARDRQKFAYDDAKTSLQDFNRAQEKNTALIQDAVNAASADTGKLKQVGDEYTALAMAIQDGDVPAMMDAQTAMTGMAAQLDQVGKSAKSSSDVLNLEFAKTADTLANQMVDASTSMLTASAKAEQAGGGYRKLGQYVHNSNDQMNAFEKTGLDMLGTIEKMIVELTIVNPLLNALQGAITGTPGTKPSMFSLGAQTAASAAGGGTGGSSGMNFGSLGGSLASKAYNWGSSKLGGSGSLTGDASSLWNWGAGALNSPTATLPASSASNLGNSLATSPDFLSTLLDGSMFGGGGGSMSGLAAAAGGTSVFGGAAAGAGALGGTAALSGGAAAATGSAAGIGGGMAGLLDLAPLAMMAFAGGGSFHVGGNGGTDSQLVAFKATPGEHVQVGPKSGPSAGMAPTTNVHIHNNSGSSARVSRSPNASGGHDIMVQIGEAMANDVNTGNRLGRAIENSFGNNRVPISR